MAFCPFGLLVVWGWGETADMVSTTGRLGVNPQIQPDGVPDDLADNW